MPFSDALPLADHATTLQSEQTLAEQAHSRMEGKYPLALLRDHLASIQGIEPLLPDGTPLFESQSFQVNLLNREIDAQKVEQTTQLDTLAGIPSTDPWIGAISDGSESLVLRDSSSQSSRISATSGSPSQPTATGRRTQAIASFNLNADLTNELDFYAIPYPSDLRLDEEGRPDMTGYPISGLSFLANNLKSILGDRQSFPVNTPGYFQFNAPLSPYNPDTIIEARWRSPVWLLNIDPDSSNRGQLLPTVASTFDADRYTPEHLLGIAPAPGIILESDTTYAYVVRRSLRDVNGRRLGVSDTFEQIRQGEAPDGPLGADVQALYAPLWETIDELGVRRQAIATATVFTTGDPVGELETLSNSVLNNDAYDLTIENLSLQASDDDSLFYEFHATVDLPQFQFGTPPYDFFGGQFLFNPEGELIQQRTEEDVPIVLTLPKTDMPQDGYPLMVYYHGSNGLSNQVVNRGPILDPGGEPTPGLGPAHVMAEQGFASLGMALPLNPERVGGDRNNAYLNPLNLAAYRDTFRQGVIEQRLILEAIEQLTIPSRLLADLDAPALPEGIDTYFIDPEPLSILGQSHGAQYALMVGAVEPKVGVVVPTGSGGFWPLLVAEGNFLPAANLLLGTTQDLNVLHPAMNLLGTAWEAADPIVYAPRLAKRPLSGHLPRPIYQPVGLQDPEFPEFIFDAMALATGVQQAGDVLWPEMQEALALEGLNGIQPYDVVNNLQSEEGSPYTGVVVQYADDGITNSHNIFAQLDAVKLQYATFFQTFYNGGRAIVTDLNGLIIT